VHVDYPIGADTARQMARASTWYRLTRPAFYVAFVIELAIAAAFAAAGRPGWAGLVVVLALSVPLALVLQTGSVARAMQRRGYRPGTVMTVDWQDEQFVVTTPDASAAHGYDAVASARLVQDAVVLRLRGARILVMIPAGAVPDAVRPRLGLRR
jgi:hypothetical protein